MGESLRAPGVFNGSTASRSGMKWRKNRAVFLFPLFACMLALMVRSWNLHAGRANKGRVAEGPLTVIVLGLVVLGTLYCRLQAYAYVVHAA